MDNHISLQRRSNSCIWICGHWGAEAAMPLWQEVGSQRSVPSSLNALHLHNAVVEECVVLSDDTFERQQKQIRHPYGQLQVQQGTILRFNKQISS